MELIEVIEVRTCMDQRFFGEHREQIIVGEQSTLICQDLLSFCADLTPPLEGRLGGVIACLPTRCSRSNFQFGRHVITPPQPSPQGEGVGLWSFRVGRQGTTSEICRPNERRTNHMGLPIRMTVSQKPRYRGRSWRTTA
jgi:hypothetical protein